MMRMMMMMMTMMMTMMMMMMMIGYHYYYYYSYYYHYYYYCITPLAGVETTFILHNACRILRMSDWILHVDSWHVLLFEI